MGEEHAINTVCDPGSELRLGGNRRRASSKWHAKRRKRQVFEVVHGKIICFAGIQLLQGDSSALVVRCSTSGQ